MFEKQGKFYADWRDRKGTRKRKSFITAKAALRFEAEQKELAHPKPKAQNRPSPKFSAPASRASTVPLRTTPRPRKLLSRVRAGARRAN